MSDPSSTIRAAASGTPGEDAMTAALASFRRQDRPDFADAWVGIEPTFSNRKAVRKWRKMSAKEGGEDAYFEDGYLLKMQRRIAKTIERRYAECAANGDAACVFASVRREVERDQWDVKRQNLEFRFAAKELEPFRVRVTLDPEIWEYSIKPVPLAWFYDERFLAFLERFVWGVPLDLGLTASVAEGGGQFSLSAKTFLGGSLLADDIAVKLNRPELATWILDWPNPDDRAFRATRRRFQAFRDVLEQYWAGAYHARATGTLTAENALLDRGFEPAAAPRPELMDPIRGPEGDAREVFQTNFAFGRAVRLRAQSVHPGYWQAQHPCEDGYRPDQIMRYGEANLNRLQISGERHVKSGKVLDPGDAPELEAPLSIAMLNEEASWENRAQMARPSARDFVEALLLDVHHARYLQAHPRVPVVSSILQDQLLGDAEETLGRNGGAKTLARLRAAAREANLEASGGRLKTDWIEPETLFWAAWRALPAGERAAIAHEAVSGFVAHVEEAATVDPRPRAAGDDPMEWHRHRVHPLLFAALAESGRVWRSGDPVKRELDAWTANRDRYLARRPAFSQTGEPAPWEEERGGGIS